MNDGPVYRVRPEAGGTRNPQLTRTLNLLHLVNDLPVDLPPQVAQEASRNKRDTNKHTRLRKTPAVRYNSDTDSDDSDQPRTYYWLRAPSETGRKTDGKTFNSEILTENWKHVCACRRRKGDGTARGRTPPRHKRIPTWRACIITD